MLPAYLTPRERVTRTIIARATRPVKGSRHRCVKHLIATQGTVLAVGGANESVGTMRPETRLLDHTLMPLQHIHATMLRILATKNLTDSDSIAQRNVTHNNQPPKTSVSTCEKVTVTFFP